MLPYSRISCNDANAMIADKTVNIVDIRDLASFNAGHITGAEHLENHSLAEYIEATPHEIPLIVCCYHGNSSQSAGAYLADKGFKEVYSLDGGFEQWAVSFPENCEKP